MISNNTFKNVSKWTYTQRIVAELSRNSGTIWTEQKPEKKEDRKIRSLLKGILRQTEERRALLSAISNSNGSKTFDKTTTWLLRLLMANHFSVENASYQLSLINQIDCTSFKSFKSLKSVLMDLFQSQMSLEAKVWSVKLWLVKCRKHTKSTFNLNGNQ